ncbi:hypothetical protein IWQ62_004054 [Dispira parvispora]|uniref:Uncharacterized protein n=1 Tax=Dispira parvispora TaxID=1520584 RepID=A0A9W8ATM6_9FUNG|nr:hypothetical protein IWQ62_004054 [Dispira parvispora]
MDKQSTHLPPTLSDTDSDDDSFQSFEDAQVTFSESADVAADSNIPLPPSAIAKANPDTPSVDSSQQATSAITTPSAPASHPSTEGKREASSPTSPARDSDSLTSLEPQRSATEDLKETPTTASPTPEAGTTSTGSGWGGWATWLPPAENLYTHAQKLTESMKGVSIDELYAKIDPDYEKYKSTTGEGTTPSTSLAKSATTSTHVGTLPSSSSPDAAEPSVAALLDQQLETETQTKESNPERTLDTPVALASEAGDKLLTTLDATFDFASNFLGNAVFGGYRTIEQANLGEKLQRLRANSEARQKLEESLAVGNTAVQSGLAALENLGRSTVAAINEQRKPTVAPAPKSYDDNSQVDSAKPNLNTWQGCFVNYKGLMYANELNARRKDKQELLTPLLAHTSGLHAKCQPILDELDSLLDIGKLLDGADLPEHSLFVMDSEDSVESMEMSEECTEYAEQTNDFINEVSQGANSVNQPKAIENHYREGTKALAEYAVVACRLVLEECDALDKQIEQFHKEPTNPHFTTSMVQELTNAVRSTLVDLLRESQWIYKVYADPLKELAERGDVGIKNDITVTQLALEDGLGQTIIQIQESVALPLTLLKLYLVYIMSVAE